jgi:hypothetical protein
MSGCLILRLILLEGICRLESGGWARCDTRGTPSGAVSSYYRNRNAELIS